MNKSIDKTQDALQVERALKLAQAVIDAARAAMDESFEAGNEQMDISIPAHLAAALSLRLDEYDREALMSVPDGAQSLRDEEQPAQQGPVAYMNPDDLEKMKRFGRGSVAWATPTDFCTQPVYTSQPNVPTARAGKPWVHVPTWRGLTDKDLAGCDDEEYKQARYWEQVLREKNT